MRVHKTLGAFITEGFFILLPALIAYLMFGQLFDGLLLLTQPIIDVLPNQLLSDELLQRLLAAVLLVAICLFVGLVANTKPAMRLGEWIEESILNRFPPYRVLKSLTTRIAGKDAPASLHPALLSVSDGAFMLVAIVENLEDDYVSVFVPMAPTPGVGFLQIVHASKLERLDASMSDALGWVLNWGSGTDKLLGPTGVVATAAAKGPAA